MSKNRLVKYEKIHQFQQHKLDLIKQQIGSQRQLIKELTQERGGYQNELVDVEAQFNVSSNGAAYNEQCNLVMVGIQRKINKVRIEIATADEKLDHLLHTFREQNTQTKSWEKLVEQESKRRATVALMAEMKSADDRYLATHSSGDSQ